MRVCVVIPTYNESRNIGKLIAQINKAVKKSPTWRVDILVVDDESPDKTAEVVMEAKKTFANVRLISGKRAGLGNAYIRGFRFALENLSPDFIMEMDADFQHNPNDINRFLKEARKGHQFIIGSRYIPGADCPNWSFKRKVYSWVANLLARTIAGLGEINDCTSGFRCIDATLFKSFDLNDIRANGYAFQLNILHVAKKRKLKIKEIPILFPDRLVGESKLGKKDMIEFFFLAFLLRVKRYHWRQTPLSRDKDQGLAGDKAQGLAKS